MRDRQLLGAVGAVRREEWPFALLMFTYVFLVIATFWILMAAQFFLSVTVFWIL